MTGEAQDLEAQMQAAREQAARDLAAALEAEARMKETLQALKELSEGT